MADDDGTVDLYETLQVSPRADPDVIEAAYRALARRYHPDRDPSPDATARMARINHAWEVLRDPERRAAYDNERGHVAPAPASMRMGGPSLTLTPARLHIVLPRGARRTLSVRVCADPPGLRVDAAVAAGGGWLSVSPATLRDPAADRVTVSVDGTRLAPGAYRGAIAFATSWEEQLLPIDLLVLRANLAARLRRGLRRFRRWPLVLMAIVLAGAALAVALLALAGR